MPYVKKHKNYNHGNGSSTRSFVIVLALSVFASFSIGIAASHILLQDEAVAQPSNSPVQTLRMRQTNQPEPQMVALPSPHPAVQFSHCRGAVRVNCVVDGDTLWVNGVKIRVADIDTPEVSQPQCAYERELGEQATRRLVQLVNAGPFEMQAWQGRDVDKYGRKLRILTREGRSIGDILTEEGLARTWSSKREPWC